MAETKKFLDQDGVAFLWSKLSMQDYPNNDVLMAVIEAIDETKADKTDLVQSDWNESDETGLSYIKNRPFYESKSSDVIEKTITFNGDFSAQQIIGCPVQGYLKLSDDIPTKENLVGHNMKVFMYQAGQSMEQEQNINNIENYLPDITFGDDNFQLVKGKGYTWDPYLIVVEEEMLVHLPSEVDFINESIQYDYFTMSPGIWTIFMDMTIVPEAVAAGEDYKIYLSEINYSYQEKSIKQLDSKYIPNNIVTDWDNINNRPFFEKIVYDDGIWTVTKDLVLTFTDQGDGLYKSNKFDGGQQIKDGASNDLRVFYWDDTPYHCVKQVLDDGTTPYFGNRWIVDSTKENTGEPFYAIKAEDHSWAHGYLYVYTRKTEATHKFEVGPAEEFIYTKQLDEKYIPDTIARVSDIPEGFSGSYNDLTDKPTIPSQASDITSNLPADYATGTTVEDALLNINSAIGSINSIIANLENTLELITVEDIDNICGTSIAIVSEMQF